MISLNRGNYYLDCNTRINTATITNANIYMASNGSGVLDMGGAVITNSGTPSISSPNPKDVVNVQFLQQYTGQSTTNITYSVYLTGTTASTPYYNSTATASQATIAGTVLTLSGTIQGVFAVGMTLQGTGVTNGTTIVSFGTGNGGIGTYNLSVSQTVSTPIVLTGTKQTTLNLTSGALFASIVALNVDGSAGGPSATFSSSKTTSSSTGNVTRLSNCAGLNTGETLRMHWLAGSNLQFSKTGLFYNGTYNIQINVIGN